jgi:exocyst complex component 1
LQSLNDDIAYIEAQSQGLQVQTANQKLLQAELRKLIETVDVDPRQLGALRDGQLGSKDGLEQIEGALMLLYKAMITIDPNMRSTRANRAGESTSGFGDNELSDMRALQEKKERYIQESSMFLERLKQYMEFDFARAFMETEGRRSGSTRLDVAAHDLARRGLWKYSPLMLFAKEVDLISWDSLIRMYQLRAKSAYEVEIRTNVEAWKKMTRKATGDEAELLWTSADAKEQEGIGTAARKMTVKRSQTLARSLRNASSEKGSLTEKAQIGRLYPYEAFAGAIEESTQLVFAEQNFIVDFFHASSTENIDFADAVLIAAPEARRGTNLMSRKMVEPDRAIAGKIRDIMDELMKFYVPLLSEMATWAVKQWSAPSGKVTDKSGDPL